MVEQEFLKISAYGVLWHVKRESKDVSCSKNNTVILTVTYLSHLKNC